MFGCFIHCHAYTYIGLLCLDIWLYPQLSFRLLSTPNHSKCVQFIDFIVHHSMCSTTAAIRQNEWKKDWWKIVWKTAMCCSLSLLSGHFGIWSGNKLLNDILLDTCVVFLNCSTGNSWFFIKTHNTEKLFGFSFRVHFLRCTFSKCILNFGIRYVFWTSASDMYSKTTISLEDFNVV